VYSYFKVVTVAVNDSFAYFQRSVLTLFHLILPTLMFSFPLFFSFLNYLINIPIQLN